MRLQVQVFSGVKTRFNVNGIYILSVNSFKKYMIRGCSEKMRVHRRTYWILFKRTPPKNSLYKARDMCLRFMELIHSYC